MRWCGFVTLWGIVSHGISIFFRTSWHIYFIFVLLVKLRGIFQRSGKLICCGRYCFVFCVIFAIPRLIFSSLVSICHIQRYVYHIPRRQCTNHKTQAQLSHKYLASCAFNSESGSRCWLKIPKRFCVIRTRLKKEEKKTRNVWPWLWRAFTGRFLQVSFLYYSFRFSFFSFIHSFTESLFLSFLFPFFFFILSLFIFFSFLVFSFGQERYGFSSWAWWWLVMRWWSWS